MAKILKKENSTKAKEYLDISMQYWVIADANYLPMQRVQELEKRLISE